MSAATARRIPDAVSLSRAAKSTLDECPQSVALAWSCALPPICASRANISPQF
jgi:hypothetical protein